jgi:hypothetical protein
MRILTDAELAEVREQLARRDPTVGGGYAWNTIAKLLDTLDALRAPSSEGREAAPTLAIQDERYESYFAGYSDALTYAAPGHNVEIGAARARTEARKYIAAPRESTPRTEEKTPLLRQRITAQYDQNPLLRRREEFPMEIGEMSRRFGVDTLTFKREPTGIRVRVNDPNGQTKHEDTIPAAEWASIVAHLADGGSSISMAVANALAGVDVR